MKGNLKIISGKYKGLTILGDDIIGTRPTMNRVKESLFACLQPVIKESNCLDLFAGSGNLGLEALSNGASSVVFVDNNKIAINTIKQNINNLKIKEQYQTLEMDYKKALKYFSENKLKFDIIFLDPPYKMYLINSCLEEITNYDLLTPSGVIVCEYENEKINNPSLNIWKERHYGNKNITIYKK